MISRLSIIEQSVDLGMLETPIMEVRGELPLTPFELVPNAGSESSEN
jgi:hypothetical protein